MQGDAIDGKGKLSWVPGLMTPVPYLTVLPPDGLVVLVHDGLGRRLGLYHLFNVARQRPTCSSTPKYLFTI
jgi:hypothetical protein